MSGKSRRDDDLRRVARATGDPEALASVADAVAGREREAGFLVVLGRRECRQREKTVAAFAKAFGLDVYTAKQSLASAGPRVLRRETVRAAAEEWVAWLGKAGLRAFVMCEAEVEAHRFVPQIVVFKDAGALIAEDAEGTRRHHSPAELACIVTGELRERVVRESARTLAAGEVPIVRESVGARNELVIDLHPRAGRDVLRIRQDTFQFGRVFPPGAGASTALMPRLLRMIRKALPGVPCHEDFHLVEDALGKSVEVLSTSSTLEARSILSPLTGRRGRETALLHSNAAAFDSHSLLAKFDSMSAQGTPGE